MTVSEKIENIENKIKRHEYNFFVLGEKTISRPELDILKVELFNLKNMITSDSLPTPQVAPDANSEANSETNPDSEPDSKEDTFKFFDGI